MSAGTALFIAETVVVVSTWIVANRIETLSTLARALRDASAAAKARGMHVEAIQASQRAMETEDQAQQGRMLVVGLIAAGVLAALIWWGAA